MKKEEERMEVLTQSYLPAFLAFAHAKIYDDNEAEDLAQEIAYQCITALKKQQEVTNLNGFLWSIAHNTLKRWYGRQKVSAWQEDDMDTYTNVWQCETDIEESFIQKEEWNQIRLEISRLSKFYRETLVYFYYEELSIRAIADHLNLSQEMVKFYLTKGRQKVKERFEMNEIGKKSIQPAQFFIYKSAIDFSKVNVWKVFEHILPTQIALICHDAAKDVTAISVESGVPAPYIEDELNYLMDAGVMIEQTKGKYRTNFHIMKSESLKQMYEQFDRVYEDYIPEVIKVYHDFLPVMRKSDFFRQEVSDQRYAWLFMLGVKELDYREMGIPEEDYAQILSCGSRAFLFATEASEAEWMAGMTPVMLEDCWVRPCDFPVMGTDCQEQLRNPEKSQALYDIYQGNLKEEDREFYAQLIEEGYAVKQEGKLFCNIAVVHNKAKVLLEQMNQRLQPVIEAATKQIYEEILKLVKATIPEQLKKYTVGYAKTWLVALASVKFREALYRQGFVSIPPVEERNPYACCIVMMDGK